MLKKKILGKKPVVGSKPAVGSVKKKVAPEAAATLKKKKPVAGAVKTGAFGRPIDPNAPAKKKVAGKRKPPVKFVFKAKADVKSAFMEVGFSTAKDGFLAAGSVTAEYIKGSPTNDNAPRYDMMIHDPDTVMALISRITMLTFASNPARRLASNKQWLLLIRMSVSKAKANEIRAGIKTAWATNAKGKLAEITDKKDLEYRKLRRSSKFLAGAFAHAIGPNDLKLMDKEYQKAQDQEEAAEDDE